MVDPSDILLFMSITFPKQILGDKLLLDLSCDYHLRLCIKKKKKKNQPKKTGWNNEFWLTQFG